MNTLLVQTGFIGDVILSTANISALKQIYPDTKITFLTTPVAQELVRHHPLIDEVLVFDKRKSQSGFAGLKKMAAVLRERNFNQVFSLHKSWRTAALLKLSNIEKRYGFKEAKGGFLYSSTAPRKDLKHDALRNLAIFRNVGREPESLPQKLSLGFDEETFEKANNAISSFGDKPFVAIAPGSVWGTKRWTVDGFVDVANEFSKNGYQVVLLGGPADAAMAWEISQKVDFDILNLVGLVSLLTSAAIISKSTLLISNDSAPLHMASATNTPVVAIFCATVPEFGFGPWMTPSRTVGLDSLACRPCARHGGNFCPLSTNLCQVGVTSSMVLESAFELLNETYQSEQVASAS